MEDTALETSRITVYRGDSRVGGGVKVTLSFPGGQAEGYTDSQGVAQIKHGSKGEAKIIVEGSTRDTFRAPGKASVYL